MDITLQYFDGCPNWKVADERLTTLAEGNPGMVVARHIVDTVEEAERVGFRGSPSILINGIDPFAQQGAPSGFPAAGISHLTGTRAHQPWSS